MLDLWLGLTAMILLAWGFVLYTALRSRIAPDVSATADSDLKLPQADKSSPIGLVRLMILGFIPVFSVALYWHYGSYAELSDTKTTEVASSSIVDELKNKESSPSVQEAIAILSAELAERPNNPEGWYVLAGTYANLKAFKKSVGAFEQALSYLSTEHPDYIAIQSEYLETLYFSQDNTINADLRQKIQGLLALDKTNTIALGLQGVDAFTQGHYQQAIELWERAQTDADDTALEWLQSSIQKAKIKQVQRNK